VTHRDMIHDHFRPGSGIEPSACPGELSLTGSYPDRCLSLGAVRERIVNVWRCQSCEVFLSESEGTLLNCYFAPMPSDAVLGLAAARSMDPRPVAR
jgi:hypothetical protein